MMQEEDDVPEPSFIAQCVQLTCTMFGAPQAQINVEIVDDQTMLDLNQQYRGKVDLTNVLSFPTELPDWVDNDLIGDIVLCPSVIYTEAQQYNKPLEARWAHMIVHGSLHLLGMLHDDTDDQDKMEAMEKSIMAQLGYQDPYLEILKDEQ